MDKYLDFAGELKKMLNMRVMVILVVVGMLRMISRSLKKGVEELENSERIKIIQTTELLRLAKILRRVSETRRDLLLL